MVSRHVEDIGPDGGFSRPVGVDEPGRVWDALLSQEAHGLVGSQRLTTNDPAFHVWGQAQVTERMKVGGRCTQCRDTMAFELFEQLRTEDRLP